MLYIIYICILCTYITYLYNIPIPSLIAKCLIQEKVNMMASISLIYLANIHWNLDHSTIYMDCQSTPFRVFLAVRNIIWNLLKHELMKSNQNYFHAHVQIIGLSFIFVTAIVAVFYIYIYKDMYIIYICFHFSLLLIVFLDFTKLICSHNICYTFMDNFEWNSVSNY